MKLYAVRYLFKEGVKNIWKNRMMSIASVGVLVVCFILTGMFSLLFINTKDTLKFIESRNTVKVFLKDSIDTEEALEVEKKLNEIGNVQSCKFYSREEALERYKEQLGELYETAKERKFLAHAYYVTLEDVSLFRETVSKIREVPEVDVVSNLADLFDKLTKFNKFVSFAGLISALLLALIALFIITNTIRLTMYSRRHEIGIMKSVGATDVFVKVPFIVEGVVIGLFSALVSTLSLNFMYKSVLESIRKNVSFFYTTGFNHLFLHLLLAFTLAGILFGVLGGSVSIKKYLEKETLVA